MNIATKKKDYVIVQTDAQKEALKRYIAKYPYFAFDTETTGLNVRKEKVIGFSISAVPGTAFYFPILSWNTKTEKLEFVNTREEAIALILELKEKQLIMWNGSFDIRIVRYDLAVELIDSLFVEAMLLKHTLEEEGDFALKKVAIQNQEALGFDAETAANQEQIELKENVTKNGGSTTKANFEMFKADLPVLGKYACADADLTLRLAILYRKKLEKEGLEKFFYDDEVMPTYRNITIPMESNGIKLDLPKIIITRKNLIQDMDRLESEIIKELMSKDPAIKWYKEMLDVKYPAKTTGAFAQKVVETYNINLPKTKTGKYSLTAKNLSKIEYESNGLNFLLGKIELTPQIQYKIQCQLHEEKMGLPINISSKKQLGEIVFKYMKVKPLSKTDGGSPQFDDTLIQHLIDKNHSWANKLSNYNKLVKIKGTYVDRFLDNHEDGYFFFRYKQHGTVSGRFSSDAQQLPRPKEDGELDPMILEYNNIIRSFFITEDDRIFIDADYESLEPHVFAHVSGDEGLRDIFRKDHDFYSTIAIVTEKLKNVTADKKADNYLGKVNKPLRQKAKSYCLGIPYGMEAFLLSIELGVSKKEAARLIEDYLNGFPKLKKWMEKSNLQAKKEGFVRSEAGRIRHLPKVKDLYSKYGDKLLNWKYRKKLGAQLGHDEVKSMYRDFKNGINNAKNYQIQSLSASIVNLAAIAVKSEFAKQNIDGKVVAQVHDQIIFDVPRNQADRAKEIVRHLMESTVELSVDLKAPPELAENWKEGH